MTRRQQSNASYHTTSTRDSRRSGGSSESQSTADTSLYDNDSRPSFTKAGSKHADCEDDLSPSTSVYPRSSTDTYSSQDSRRDLAEADQDMADAWVHNEVPPLPVYRQDFAETNVRPSNPDDFAALFPSMNRLSIRHDDLSSDGNMNLRVDTVVPGRRRRTIQLFHLRMHDLNKREFSLRRYCRESGREVCNSKRKYEEPTAAARPALQRSMSSAIKTMGRPAPLARTRTASSMMSSSSTRSRPGTSYSTAAEADDELNAFDQAASLDTRKQQAVRSQPTNTIKLEFSNYARVDVQRCGSGPAKRYEFEWWGHRYSWKRTVDKHTGAVSFHLMRDGKDKAPVAHIVPEPRTPNQLADDEYAGAWIPPCHMWLSDKSLIDAMTDVADVVVATGLMALVDDCIKERWGVKRTHRIGIPLTSVGVDVEHVGPRALVQQIFSRRNSDQSARSLRHVSPVAAY